MQQQLKFLLMQLALKAVRVNVYVTIFLTSHLCFCLETERKFTQVS